MITGIGEIKQAEPGERKFKVSGGGGGGGGGGQRIDCDQRRKICEKQETMLQWKVVIFTVQILIPYQYIADLLNVLELYF